MPRPREVEDHGTRLGRGGLAARQVLREQAPKGLELGELAIQGFDPLPQQRCHAPALVGRAGLVMSQQLADVVQGESDDLRFADEPETRLVLLAEIL